MTSTANTDPYEFLRAFWASQDSEPGSAPFIAHKIPSDRDWGDWSWEESQRPIKFRRSAIDFTQTDLYFTPNFFHDRKRKAAISGKMSWLFADLDEVDPYSLEIRPQLAWETSPGRFQCAWKLSTPIGPRAWERLNKAMTYHVGADSGGWALTKVLRIPGTTSLKHGSPFFVRLLWASWEDHTPGDALRGIVRASIPASDPLSGKVRLPTSTGAQIRREKWADLPTRLRKLTGTKTVRTSDDRSVRLWEMYKLALTAGLTPGETVRIVQDTPWNKYAGQRRELRQLMEEVQRCQLSLTDPYPKKSMIHFNASTGDGDRSYFARTSVTLTGRPEDPDYIIRNVLARGQVCVLSADSGVGKSWVALDLVRACVLGRPWLDRKITGRKVMYVDEENGMKIINGRLRGLLTPHKLTSALESKVNRNLYLCSRNGISIGDSEQHDELERTISSLTPSLLIIDTAMSATAVNEVNDNSQVVQLMKTLRSIAERYSLAVVLMHHDRKPDKDQAPDPNGTSMMGARQWSGQADAHLTLRPHDRHTSPLKSGKRGLRTEVILHCAKLRDDVPFEDELIQINSIKSTGGHIESARITTHPAPAPLSMFADPLDQLNLTPGETADIDDAALTMDLSQDHLRTLIRASQYHHYNDDKTKVYRQ